DPNNKYFVLDDGSGLSWGGCAGVVVSCGSLNPPTNGWVVVTGICASEPSEGGVVPVILIRDEMDIQVL
ncbi:MAG: hypothetical protein ACP5R5_07760, partial [Armatimonadota bacterium]